MPGVTVEAGAVVNRVLAADGVTIGKNASVVSKDGSIELIARNVKGVE